MTTYMKPIFDEMGRAFGLGSSTRGNPVLVAGERRDANRTEADFRKVRCKQGETFEQAEARLFLEARDAFNEAIQEARRIGCRVGRRMGR